MEFLTFINSIMSYWKFIKKSMWISFATIVDGTKQKFSQTNVEVLERKIRSIEDFGTIWIWKKIDVLESKHQTDLSVKRVKN